MLGGNLCKDSQAGRLEGERVFRRQRYFLASYMPGSRVLKIGIRAGNRNWLDNLSEYQRRIICLAGYLLC